MFPNSPAELRRAAGAGHVNASVKSAAANRRLTLVPAIASPSADCAAGQLQAVSLVNGHRCGYRNPRWH
jgi:hypothetical protein